MYTYSKAKMMLIFSEAYFYPYQKRNEERGNELITEILEYKKHHGSYPNHQDTLFEQYLQTNRINDQQSFEYYTYEDTAKNPFFKIGFHSGFMDMCWRSNDSPWEC